MRRSLLLLVALSSLTVAACGDDANDAGEGPARPEKEQKARKPPDRCAKVPRDLVAALRDSLEPERKLTRPAAVKSADSFETPASLKEGVYFVSADVTPNPGLVTWAVSKKAFDTGGGLIFGIGPATQAASELGADVDPSNFGVTEESDGYAESHDCVGKL